MAVAQNDPKKLVDYLLSDLRTLSTEAKKKHNQVKEASESGLVKVRNISTASQNTNLLRNLRNACSEILNPLLLGCSSKNPRLVQISLQAIQKMLQYQIVEPSCASSIVNELWFLTEAECEELRVLQTITSLVTTELLVMDVSLAKCIVLAIKLNFSKDPHVINAASAAVRQLFSSVFERVVQEDGLKNSELTIAPQSVSRPSPTPPTLRPCAADGYRLLKDLNSMIRKENPTWLEGVKRITMTLSLELLESALKNYPSIFYKHAEYAELLKNQICPQLVKMFAGEKEIKIISQHSSSSHSDHPSSKHSSALSTRPPFPIMMRSLRIVMVLITNYHEILTLQCEILITFLLELLNIENPHWENAIALEVLHRFIVQPDLLSWLCENYDLQQNSAKIIRLMTNKLTRFIKHALETAQIDDELKENFTNSFGAAGFLYKCIFIPLHENLSAKKWILLDWLEKHEPAPVPEGYALSIAYSCLVDCTHSVYAAVVDDKSPQTVNGVKEHVQARNSTLFGSAYESLLEGLSTLLEHSVDDTISEAILNCISTLVLLACRIGNSDAKDSCLRALCRAALPVGYFSRYIESSSPATLNHHGTIEANGVESSDTSSENESPNQVVAMGTICPTPSLPSSQQNATVMLTAKNLLVIRPLISTTHSNGSHLTDSWDIILATLQHLMWILGMKPTSTGSFRTGGDTTGPGTDGAATTAPSNVVLTTAASSELPDLNSMLSKLFESTAVYDDVALHHVIAALCKLSSEAMMVAQSTMREPSFFSISKLLQTAMSNLQRLEVYWRPVTAHLIEVCTHSHTKLREWGSISLTTLIRSAMKRKPPEELNEEDIVKRQQLIVAPLAALSEVDYIDVIFKQLDCLMNILQSDSQQLRSQLWPTIITIVNAVVENKTTTDNRLVEHGYQGVNLIIKEFLDSLPFHCVQMLVETDAKYGQQQISMNISLSAVGQLWNISDYARRKSVQRSDDENEKIWLVLYNCLSELCVDPRPPVRKSACDTLLQTVAAHGQALNVRTWSHMILFPMLDKVRVMTRNASTQRVDSAALGASNLLVHHSRDTESKQWAETTVKTLSGVVKIFNAQRSTLLSLDNFPECWITLLKYIEYTASTDNSEMSLAALKNFQELLFGRASSQMQESVSTGDRRSGIIDDTPPLPEKLWIVSWESWIRIANLITNPNAVQVPHFEVIGDKGQGETKHFIPGQFHWTTLLSVFPSLFSRVKKDLPVEELKYKNVPSILKAVASAPVAPEQTPFLLNSANSEINPTQETILECVRVIFQEEIDPTSKLRPALPDLLRILLDFSLFAIRPPTTEFVITASKDQLPSWVQQNLIAFAELSLKTAVEYYGKVASYPEIIRESALVDIITCLSEPLSLKYQCPAQTTWKLAASALISVCRIGLPVARENSHMFTLLWPQLATTLEKFLFTTSRSPTPLNSDERKRHEFIDCQMIELIRMEILPHANRLPCEFMQRIIDILNRGSISTLDPHDVFASEAYAQRTDLSKVCFDALLSMSQSETPDIVQTVHGRAGGVVGTSQDPESSTGGSLGSSAISSLLHRCQQIMNNYARDQQSSGHLKLPQERIFEVISVLRAISSLIEGLTKHPEAVHSPLYSHLVNLHPVLVQMIPSCRSDQQVELSVMTALNSYQTLLLLNIHKKA